MLRLLPVLPITEVAVVVAAEVQGGAGTRSRLLRRWWVRTSRRAAMVTGDSINRHGRRAYCLFTLP